MTSALKLKASVLVSTERRNIDSKKKTVDVGSKDLTGCFPIRVCGVLDLLMEKRLSDAISLGSGNCPSISLPHFRDSIPQTNVKLPGLFKTSLEIPLLHTTNVTPFLDINLPGSPGVSLEMPVTIEEQGQKSILLRSMIKIRRKKMNKHRLKKRRKKNFEINRNLKILREAKKAKKRANRKKILVAKLEKIRKVHPQADIFNRPYILYRLKNW